MMFLPTCKDVSTALAEASDELPWHRALLFRLHLGMCDHCSRFQRQLRLLGDAFRAQRPSRVAVESLQNKLLDRFKKG